MSESLVHCESCGSLDTRIILDSQVHEYMDSGRAKSWEYKLRQCRNCGMGFISPKPSWEILHTFYDLDYGAYDATNAKPEDESESLKYKIAKLRYATYGSSGVIPLLKSFLGLLTEWVTGKTVSYSLGIPLQLAKDTRIFELGFGSGNWLLAMSRLGYSQIYGYDLESNAANLERLESSGIRVSSGDFMKNTYPENYFDCIRLEHVFEHLLEPVEVLEKLHGMLKPGGVLVMNFPSIQSLSFKLSSQYYAHRDSPRHLFLHTPASASNMMNKSGLKMQDCKLYSVTKVFESTANNSLKARGRCINTKWLNLLSPIYNLLCRV